jgi:hypothetical protein
MNEHEKNFREKHFPNKILEHEKDGFIYLTCSDCKAETRIPKEGYIE